MTQILIIIVWLTKIIYYKLVKIIINTFGFVKVVLDIVIEFYGILNLILTDKSLLFTFKF